jgi:hypothetical protein
MKKFNLLSRAEMKKVMGGNLDDESIDDGGISGGGVCDNWWKKDKYTCYNCCINYHQQGPTPVGDGYYSQCATKCGF